MSRSRLTRPLSSWLQRWSDAYQPTPAKRLYGGVINPVRSQFMSVEARDRKIVPAEK